MVSPIMKFFRILIERIENYVPLRVRFRRMEEYADELEERIVELSASVDALEKEVRRLRILPKGGSHA